MSNFARLTNPSLRPSGSLIKFPALNIVFAEDLRSKKQIEHTEKLQQESKILHQIELFCRFETLWEFYTSCYCKCNRPIKFSWNPPVAFRLWALNKSKPVLSFETKIGRLFGLKVRLMGCWTKVEVEMVWSRIYVQFIQMIYCYYYCKNRWYVCCQLLNWFFFLSCVDKSFHQFPSFHHSTLNSLRWVNDGKHLL